MPLPIHGSQSYADLAKYIIKQLPDTPFVLLVESFSGGLAPHILQSNKPVKAVIFAASFLSCPNKLLPIAKWLPLNLLLSLPFSHWGCKYWCLGADASDELVDKLKDATNQLPSKVLKARLTAMQKLSVPSTIYTVPSFYINATDDRLVVGDRFEELCACFINLRVLRVEGPHFILQARAQICAKLIERIVVSLESESSI